MAVTTANLEITWELLPDDFKLPDDPVDNINQPSLAAALTEALELAGQIGERTLTPTNYGICATLNQKLVIKAPDWAFIPEIRVPREDVIRSYTPQLQGEFPVIVMEFISETEGTEYSSKPTYPPGKWFFYEQVLEVPNYAIFQPSTGVLELYGLDESGRYELREPDENQRYFIPQLHLFLGVWQGTRGNRTGYWLRWWNEAGELLLWGSELVERERQNVERERQNVERERLRAERLVAQLRAAGIEPEV
ncbi:MAG: Uma2 family endonuclease [Limnoraphis robusta]|uniref:Uma2 family endonuclease n=1 Tax=Limnoraphis robusta TaxID=1118279 RepID=UPI002B21FA6C|nr:Uma2 family endonuclease [Limnoraphis robusta]MEA5498588.1 Uma2 family endonuclease [Limnoraphis robusta BA-68 BA1]